MTKVRKLPRMQSKTFRAHTSFFEKVAKACNKRKIRLSLAIREGLELWLDRELDRD